MPGALVLTGTPLPTPLKISNDGFQKATSILDLDEKPVDENTRLLPDKVAKDVIMGWNTELARQTTLEEAARLTELLLRGYPNLKPRDPEGYAAVITKAFAAFPFCVSRAVMIELPKKLTFEPRQADLVLALTAEKERIQVVVGRAQMHLMQRKKREEKAAEEARYAAAQSPEAKARVKEIYEAARKALKPMDEENPNAG